MRVGKAIVLGVLRFLRGVVRFVGDVLGELFGEIAVWLVLAVVAAVGVWAWFQLSS
jgi:hypothetical protein